jgi:polysulfide reductase chain B
MISIMCYQCKAEAIVKDEQTGIVRVLADRRKGSRDCIEACPYGVIQLDAVANKAHK